MAGHRLWGQSCSQIRRHLLASHLHFVLNYDVYPPTCKEWMYKSFRIWKRKLLSLTTCINSKRLLATLSDSTRISNKMIEHAHVYISYVSMLKIKQMTCLKRITTGLSRTKHFWFTVYHISDKSFFFFFDISLH